MGKGKSCIVGIFEEPASIFFWSLIVVMFVIVIGNLILTMSIISLFKIGFGMEAFELVPEAKSVKFFGTTEFETVFKRDGYIESFRDDPLKVEAESEEEIRFNLVDRKGHNHNRFSMSDQGMEINQVKDFMVRHPDSKEAIFTTQPKLKYNVQKPIRNLEANSVLGSYVASPIDEKLLLDSGNNIHIRGVEGTNIESRGQQISAKKNIEFKSYNGSITLNASDFEINISRLPIVKTSYPSIDRQYKLCICYPKGLIFRAPVPKDLSEEDAMEYRTCEHAARKYCA